MARALPATAKNIRRVVDRCINAFGRAQPHRQIPSANEVFGCASKTFERVDRIVGGRKKRRRMRTAGEVERARKIMQVARQVTGSRARAKGMKLTDRRRVTDEDRASTLTQPRPRRRRKR